MTDTIKYHNVSRETLIRARELYDARRDQYETYVSQLIWWNKKINLVSRDVSRETIQEHVVHSLLPSAMGLLSGMEVWVDTGTGGGLPGIPLAIAEPHIKWILNDIVGKKILAVKQIAGELKLPNIKLQDGSIDSINVNERCGIISKHAFKTDTLLACVRRQPWDRVILFKGVSEAEQECSNLNGSNEINLFTFDFGASETFYSGKGIVDIRRTAGE